MELYTVATLGSIAFAALCGITIIEIAVGYLIGKKLSK